MRRMTIVVSLLMLAATSCSSGTVEVESTPLSSPAPDVTTPTRSARPTKPEPEGERLESERRCGDGVCDGPETAETCPEDCAPSDGSQDRDRPTPPATTRTEASESTPRRGTDLILYHIVKHTVSSHEMGDTTCHTFTLSEFLDGGCVRPNGSDREILALKDYPVGTLTAKKHDRFYYISSSNSPAVESFGMTMFDWDVEDQTLWSSGFGAEEPTAIVASQDGFFPGGVTTAPGNKHLLYLVTLRMGQPSTEAGGFVVNRFNPFLSDSSLMLATSGSGAERDILAESYNRQLFASFADFSPDGDHFYTIRRTGDSFEFVRISLTTGDVEPFVQAFPRYDWASIDWDGFFPRSEDFSYASFAIAPDETRLVAYRNIFTPNLETPCLSEASHNLWVFSLEDGSLERYEDRAGYVTDAAWKPDSSAFALALVGHSGCYPDYLDSRIDTFDTEGRRTDTLVEEPQSKITTLGWSPDGLSIAYDVYGTDFVGRLKLIKLRSDEVNEILNTEDLGYDLDRSTPVTLLFADWTLDK